MAFKDKEKEKEYRRKYQQEHKDLINAQRRASSTKRISSRKYYQEHKDEINEARNVKVDCPCGGRYTKRHQATHFQCEKHKTYLAALTPPTD